MKKDTSAGKSFVEQVADIKSTLEDMGYDVAQWDHTNMEEAPVGTVTLVGVDMENNTIELPEMTIFTIAQARRHVDALHKSWTKMIEENVQASKRSFKEKFDAMSEGDKQTFLHGLSLLALGKNPEGVDSDPTEA